jgi:hypothetical protein
MSPYTHSQVKVSHTPLVLHPTATSDSRKSIAKLAGRSRGTKKTRVSQKPKKTVLVGATVSKPLVARDEQVTALMKILKFLKISLDSGCNSQKYMH